MSNFDVVYFGLGVIAGISFLIQYQLRRIANALECIRDGKRKEL